MMYQRNKARNVAESNDSCIFQNSLNSKLILTKKEFVQYSLSLQRDRNYFPN